MTTFYRLSSDSEKRIKKSRRHIRLFQNIRKLEKEGHFSEEKKAIQHGSTTVYAHSVNVARLSSFLADHLPLKVHQQSLVRGALLHDYFLYDWHHKDECPSRWHGFTHPGCAAENAERDFRINDVEKDIIRHHMFPLTLSPPKTKEGWIVCIADKICAVQETAGPMVGKAQKSGAAAGKWAGKSASRLWHAAKRAAARHTAKD